MESFGETDRMVHALHFDGYGNGHQSKDKRLTVPGLKDGFHIFAMEWSPEGYIFFVDGKETWRTDFGGVSQVPAYVKVTGEISSLDWAVTDKWSGDQDPDAYPDEYIIDYVRVWARETE